MTFLDHLEQQRHNSVRSRNARLAALRSFLKFAGHRDVASLQVIERALGVPVKRFERPMFGYLTRDEILAVIGESGDSWLSQRDHALFLLMYNTGARVSEIVGVKVGDVVLDPGTGRRVGEGGRGRAGADRNAGGREGTPGCAVTGGDGDGAGDGAVGTHGEVARRHARCAAAGAAEGGGGRWATARHLVDVPATR